MYYTHSLGELFCALVVFFASINQGIGKHPTPI